MTDVTLTDDERHALAARCRLAAERERRNGYPKPAAYFDLAAAKLERREPLDGRLWSMAAEACLGDAGLSDVRGRITEAVR